MLTLKRLLLAAVAVALAVAIAGCSDEGETNESAALTSGSATEDVVFGSGDLPETIPDGFPLPAGSAVGSTMVVTTTGFTEVIVRLNAERALAAAYFDQELPKAGFAVDKSADDNGLWLIEYSIDGVNGTIEISEPVEGIAQAVIRHNVP